MSRAYIVYILMFAVLAGGLWVVIELGESLRAPDDLSGEWTVAWKTAPPPEVADSVLRIDQSGRFFIVRLGNKRRPVSMVLQPGWKGARDGPNLNMNLARDVWKMNVSGKYPPNETWRIPEAEVKLTGPSSHAGIARRVGAAAPSTRPAAHPAAAATHPTAIVHAR